MNIAIETVLKEVEKVLDHLLDFDLDPYAWDMYVNVIYTERLAGLGRANVVKSQLWLTSFNTINKMVDQVKYNQYYDAIKSLRCFIVDISDIRARSFRQIELKSSLILKSNTIITKISKRFYFK